MDVDNLTKHISSSRMKKERIPSIYKYVGGYIVGGLIVWQAYIPMYRWSKHYTKERDAALGVDMKLIYNNRNPINILTPCKTNGGDRRGAN